MIRITDYVSLLTFKDSKYNIYCKNLHSIQLILNIKTYKSLFHYIYQALILQLIIRF